MPMELELAQWEQEADMGERELKTRPTLTRIRRLEEELGAMSPDHKRRKVIQYKIGNVGAGIGGGFGNTQELNVKKYNKVMDGQDVVEWAKEVAKEHRRMLKDRVWHPRLRGAGKAFKTITSTWAMKKKASGD